MTNVLGVSGERTTPISLAPNKPWEGVIGRGKAELIY
jgi:hypothetical protein